MKKAFSLVEVLVVLAIIGILLTFLLPGLGKARAQARMVQCASQMHQIGLATQMYLSDNENYYSPKKYQGGVYYRDEGLRERPKSAYRYGDASYKGWYAFNSYLDYQYINKKETFMCPSSSRSGQDAFTRDMTFNWEICSVANGGASGIPLGDRIGERSYLKSLHIKNPSELILTTDTNGSWLKVSGGLNTAGWIDVRHQGKRLNHVWADGHGSSLTWTQFYNNPHWLMPLDDASTNNQGWDGHSFKF